MKQGQDGMESPLRRRGQRMLSSLSSQSRTLPSSIKSVDASLHSSTPSMPTLDRFEYFTLLPLELQAYVLTFLPSRTLHKTMSRTNRYYRELIESHTRRRILTLMSPSPWDIRSTADHYKAYYQRRPANVLVFEAQRPIDTLTTKHTLHFSHFSRTESERSIGNYNNNSSSSSSTLAHFSFVPIEKSDVRSPSQDSAYTATSSDRSGADSNATMATNSLYVSPSGQRTSIPGVHANDQNRLVQRTVTSSVSTTPEPPDRSYSARGQQFTDVASPMQWRETTSTPTQLVYDQVHSAARSRSRGRGAGYEGFDATPPALTGHWSEPIASSSAAYDSDYFDSSEDLATREANKRARQQRKPMYRFQLDPLDSFETWILSLTLQRKSESISSFRGSTRPLHWKKTVAEGLDRVFRDWFSPGQAGNEEMPRSYGGTDSALHRATLIATGVNSQSMPSNSGMSYKSPEKQASRDEAEEEEQPEPKMLEFDGTSCTMMIQPHAVDSSHPMHPALTSMSSHHYLSNSSQSFHHWQNSLTSRVEYTFHCESLTINAARLLNVLEDVEKDVDRAVNLAKQRGAHIVAGSSGDTSWAYSTGDSSYASNGSNTSSSIWTGGNRQGEGDVSFILFGAAVRD